LSCVSAKPSMPQLACVQAWEAPPRPFAISQCLSSLPLASTQVTFQSLQAPSSCVHYGPGHKYLASCRVRRCSHRPDSMRCRPRQRRRSSPTAGHTTARRPMSGARVSCCTSSCSAVRSRPAAGGPRPTVSVCARIAWSLTSPQARAPMNLVMHVRARRIPLRATIGCGRSAALSKGACH